jgi:hyperosmotically inducible protein
MFKTLLLLAAVWLAATAVPGASGQQPPLPTDPQIAAQIRGRLADQDIGGVKVDVYERRVTLSGVVNSAWEREEAVRQARKIPAVATVVNDLAVARAASDYAVCRQVTRGMLRFTSYTIFDDVAVDVFEGVVTLTGRVTRRDKALDIADVASRIYGVQDVRNELRPLPLSVADDRLRVALAHAIYFDPLFYTYANQVSPPIHIVVEHGRVTLTGVVQTRMERIRAELDARRVPGVLAVENRLRVEWET